MIFQLIYTCALKSTVKDAELQDIARHASEANKAKGLTGMLLCKDGSALQVLEGERATVEATYRKIERDPRVTSTLVLIRRETTRREFPNWSMGFRYADTTEAAFSLCENSFQTALPDDASAEVRTISRTFARVNGLSYA